MWTKKLYKAIAEIIKNVDLTCPSNLFGDGKRRAALEIAMELCGIFGEDNPNFDKEKFLKACGF